MSVAKAEHQEGTFKGPVVILADMDKSDMDEAVMKGLQGPNHLEVPCTTPHQSITLMLLLCSSSLMCFCIIWAAVLGCVLECTCYNVMLSSRIRLVSVLQ